MSFPEIAVIISDDARQELGGKLTIVGIYTAEMVFTQPEMPTLFPRLAFTFLCRWPDEASREPVALEVYFPGEENEPGIQFTVDPRAMPVMVNPPPEGQRGMLANVAVEMLPLKSTGHFRIYGSVGSERKEVYKLRVTHIAPDTSILMPPEVPS